ncbi:hypothetical protein BHE97_18175 [Aeromicrobium sp. PE09-221]|uniref:DUF3788 family protein n=1 Tax=Aeromicrobium sp. PE09-221 TaxID=1898043 RepID=UPI000B3E7367|nr:DUF3788 family protein [Aeromicrobium sp. PE09-221]OUZ07033.1 hypothetical protein BHE97_18175 [Aeromicrobium sp. PE09-221]
MGNVFTDAQVRPEQGAISVALGDASSVWDEATEVFASAGAEVTWRHYRDGGWLAKASRNGKTLAWLCVTPGVLQVSFHFAERLRETLSNDRAINGHLRERIAQMPTSGNLFSIPLEVRTPDEVGDVKQLVALKLSTK